MAFAPCKDCVDRELGCHSKCDKYKTFKEQHMRDTLRPIKLGTLDCAKQPYHNSLKALRPRR